MSIVQFLFDFNGRIRRLHFWLFFLCLSAVYGGLFWQFGHWEVHHNDHHFVSLGVTYLQHNPLFGLLGLAAIWAKLAVTVKRWHDRDKSGWWILIGLVPVIGWLWQLIECGFMEGTPGDNRFGRSPK